MLALAAPDLDNGRGPTGPRPCGCAWSAAGAADRRTDPVRGRAQGEVVPDLKRKLPGGGLWISASRAGVAEAVRRNQFSRGFKRDLRVAPRFPPIPNPAGTQRDRGAGHGRQGGPGGLRLQQGRGRPQQGQSQALIHASDGAADGIRKLDAIAAANGGNRGEFAEFPDVTVPTSENWIWHWAGQM